MTMTTEWKAFPVKYGNIGIFSYPTPQEEILIAEVPPQEHQKKHADLIAAAPEMLACLEDALDVMGTWDEAEPGWAVTARAVIKKAKGE
jgi:hypothetical protein